MDVLGNIFVGDMPTGSGLIAYTLFVLSVLLCGLGVVWWAFTEDRAPAVQMPGAVFASCGAAVGLVAVGICVGTMWQ